MQNNVISFNRTQQDEITEPTDLMGFKELEIKHGFKYGYLYKWSCLEGKLTIYPRGSLKLSEREVLEFERERGFKKYGRNQKKNLYW